MVHDRVLRALGPWRCGCAVVAVTLALMLILPLRASASISFQGATQGSVRGASSLTLAVPPQVAPGDVMIASVAVGGKHGIPVTAPGWTPIATTSAGSALGHYSLYRVPTAAEPSAYSFAAASDSRESSGGIAAYSGVDTADPIDAVADAAGKSADSVPSVTTSAADDVVIAVSRSVRP